MNWFVFAFVAIVTYVLQTTLAGRLQVWGARPDWMIVIMVFYALHARTPGSIIAGWLMGLLADCATIERAGMVSLSFGLTAALIAVSRDHLFRFNWITQILVTAAACGLVRVIWLAYRGVVYGGSDATISSIFRGILLTSLYTGLWAPLVHYALLRFSRGMGLSRPRHIYSNTR